MASSTLSTGTNGRIGPKISSSIIGSPGVTSVIRVGLIFSFCSSASPPKTTFPRVERISDIRRLCHVCVWCVSVQVCACVCVRVQVCACACVRALHVSVCTCAHVVCICGMCCACDV